MSKFNENYISLRPTKKPQLSNKSGGLHKSLRHFVEEKQHFSGDFFSGKSLKRTLCTEKTALSSSSPDSRRNVSRKEQRGQKRLRRDSEKVLNFSYLDCYAGA